MKERVIRRIERLEKREEGIRTLIGEDFNARTGETGGGLRN